MLTGDANADGETEIEVCFFISADLGGVIKHGLGDEALGISISFFLLFFIFLCNKNI